MTNYWEARIERLNKETFRNSDKYVRGLRKLYEQEMDNIEGKIYNHLSKLQEEAGGISLFEAKKLLNDKELDLFKMDLDGFMKKSQGNISPELEKELNIISRRVRISRLQAMEVELKKTVASLMSREENGLFDELGKAYQSRFYKELYELQKITGYDSVRKISKEDLDIILKDPWTSDGREFSQRIWDRGDKLVNSLKDNLTRNIASGASPKESIKDIESQFNVSKAAASRLVYTETAAISSKATQDSYKRIGVKKYEILATLDLRTSDICRSQDGKTYDIKDYRVGITAPPFHPNCRTDTIPFFDDDLERQLDKNIGRMARNPENGKSEVVENINYENWYKKYVKGDKVDNSGYNINEKELKILIDEVNGLNIKEASKDDMIDLGEKVNEAFKINEKLGNKEELKSIFSNFRDCGNKITDDTFELGDIWDADRSEIVKEQLKKTFSYYPEEWSKIPEKHNRKLFVRMSNRGYFMEGAYHPNRGYSHSLGKDMDGYLTIVTNGTRKSTPFHEIGHMVEWANPEVLRIEKEFIESRTINESPVKLDDLFPNHGYTSDEVTLKDDFISPYIGKVYDGATEVLSIGLESIFEPGEGLVKSIENGNYIYKKITDDKEYLNLIIGLILKG